MISQRTTTRWLIAVSATLLGLGLVLPLAQAKDAADVERQLLSDAADKSLDAFSLLQAALIASGVTEVRELDRYCADFKSRIRRSAKNAGEDSTVPQSERAFQLLYDEFLTGDYHFACTEMNRALDDGDYNCVTATVLYHCICEAYCVSPVAVATKTHVRSRFISDRVFDVETTCRDWFDVSRRDPVKQSSRTNQPETRQLSNVELVAKIYYNRGVSLLEKKAFDNAIDLLNISLKLDPIDLPAHENLAAGLNNWALATSDAGNFEHAVELLHRGQKLRPGFAPFEANDVHIHQRWAVHLCDEGRFSEAIQVLRAAHLRRPEVALFDRGRLAVYGQWAVTLLESGDTQGAAQLLEEATASLEDAHEISQVRALAIQTAAKRLAVGGRHRELNQLVQWGAELAPIASELQ